MSNQELSLTVCIPTYNRASIVDTVKALLPQLTNNVQIKIFDNCSDTPVTDILKDYLTKNITIVRNPINVGAAGNIIKCLEYCDTKWMWLLSDDDVVAEDAISTIIKTVTTHPDISYVKYHSNLNALGGVYEKEVVTTGQKEFILNIKDFGNILFISSALYNAHEIKKSIKNAYYFTQTFSPQVAFVLAYLASNPQGKVLFSPASIVQWSGPESNSWNYNLVNKSLSDFVYMVQGTAERKVLFEKINERHPIRGTFKTSLLQRAAKLLTTVAIAKQQNREHDMLADYFTSRSFIYWSKNSSGFLFLFKIIFAALFFVILKLPIISQLAGISAKLAAKYILKNYLTSDKLIYNRFAFYNKDYRL